MNFIADEQLPPALAIWLTSLGHQAVHIHDEGLGGASDSDIWAACVQADAVLITKDRDVFIRRSAIDGPCVAWVRLGNMKVGDMMRKIREAWPQTMERLAAGRPIVELA